MLPKVILDRLLVSGLLSKHVVEVRANGNRIEWRHATKGWRGRSVRSLRSLGVL